MYGTAGYEFWGADWLTRNPFEWGIHRETGDREGAKLLEEAKTLAPIPNAGVRKSELLLPDPDRLTGLRDRIGEAASRLSR